MGPTVSVELSFHGAARTVTGSRYRLQVGKHQSLIDCGLFQGYRELKELNWREPPFDVKRIEQVLVTHAHIDHIGALPRLVKQGFKGPIYCTKATKQLARLMLLDSAKIHEEDARYANKKGYSRHKPALPLYDEEDAKRTLKQFEALDRGEWLDLHGGVRVCWHAAGHILGSDHIEVRVPRGQRGEGEATIVFSGDIGRYDMPLHIDPSPRPHCDVLICESTYGDRDHQRSPSIEEQLCDILEPVFEQRGTVLIPAFAVGRSQQLTWILRDLMDEGRLPKVPLHIDSPMAVDATRIYSEFLDEHHLDPEVFEDGRTQLFPSEVELCRSATESKRLNNLEGPRIIISASGMLTGGRSKHHLARLAGGRKNLILLAGYQAAGTLGRKLLEGAPTVWVHGQEREVRAQCQSIHGLSAHGDRTELARWIREGEGKPKQVFLTHGEPEAAFAFAQQLHRDLELSVEVPAMDDTVDLIPYFG